MATESPLIHDGSQTIADSTLTGAPAQQFLAVKLSTAADRTSTLASTGGESISGILQNTPSVGQSVDIGILGVSKAQVGATLIASGGVALMTEAGTGFLIPKTSTNAIVAYSLQAAAVGTITTVRLVAPAG